MRREGKDTMRKKGKSGTGASAAGCIARRGAGFPVRGGNCDGSQAQPGVPQTLMHRATSDSYDCSDIRFFASAGWVR